MKLTKETLKQIIKEELEAVMEYNKELVGGDSSLDRIQGVKTTLSKVSFTSDPNDQFKYKLDKQLGDKEYVMMPDRGDGFLFVKGSDGTLLFAANHRNKQRADDAQKELDAKGYKKVDL
jgi:hypothetical protein